MRKVTKTTNRPSHNFKVSEAVKQELRKSVQPRRGGGGGGAQEAVEEAVVVVPEGQKRKSRRSSHFNYNLEDSEDSDFVGEFED